MTIFILNHSNGRPGGLDTLKEYIQSQGHRIIQLSHPLDNYTLQSTNFLINDEVLKTYKRKSIGGINLILDFIISLRAIYKNKFDIFIGINNFDTMPAIICKLILRKKIPKLIYYPRDFSDNRFSSKLMNLAYLLIEKFVCKYSDIVISNTKRAEEKRIKLGLKKSRSFIISNPVKLYSVKFHAKHIQKNRFIYVGDVNREHGLYELIETLFPIIKKLVIIGSGDDWKRTIDLAKSKKFELEIYCEKDRRFVISYLQLFNGFGLAPYNDISSWTYYCSPLKVSEYISCGLPVLLSSVPEVANIVKNNYGVVYKELNLNVIKNNLDNFNENQFSIKAKNYYENVKVEKLFVPLGL